MNSEQRRELLARTAALRATGITLQEIADKLNDEGFTLGDGGAIKKMNVSGYLHTLKKRSNGSVGVSRAEAIASRNATIEAQIQALKAQQLEGVTDLPRVIVRDDADEYAIEMSQEGGIEFWGDLSLDRDETVKLVNWIKENF